MLTETTEDWCCLISICHGYNICDGCPPKECILQSAKQGSVMIYLADKLGFTMTVQQQKKMLHENICFIIDITGFSGHQSDECYIWHIVYLGIIFKCFACLNYLLAFVCNFYGISVLKKVGFVSLKSF